MHIRAVLILIVALTVLLSNACAHGAPVGAGEMARQELDQTQGEFLAALSAGDLERTTAHFAEDAVVHVANMPPLQGRDAIRRFYGNVFRFLSASESTPEALRVSSGGDMGYSSGRVVNVFAGEQGQAEYAGKYLLVWERRGGDWQITRYSISSNRPDASR
jgi:ketosteroid isomerase-like protein